MIMREIPVSTSGRIRLTVERDLDRAVTASLQTELHRLSPVFERNDVGDDLLEWELGMIDQQLCRDFERVRFALDAVLRAIDVAS